MKELSVEEKAKRYDEAVINGSRLWESDVITRESYEYIFPELRKSEDERMRNAAINACKYMVDNFENSTKQYEDAIAWLEKQGEQKPTDKVEPKFKVGDWIVSNVSHEDYRICKILKIENDEYVIESIYGYQGHNNFETFDKVYHLWDINEAKDGDLLAFYIEYRGNKMVQIGIIEKYVGKHGGCSNTFKIYVGVNWENNLQIGKYMGCSDIRPATKEQRDTLEKAMADAGYTFDFEKKELKKIIDEKQIKKNLQDNSFRRMLEQNPAWTEEDSMHLTNAILTAEKEWGIESCTSKWLKSLKDRYTLKDK